MDLTIKIAYYSTIFVASFIAGRAIGKYLARKNREDRIASYHQMNAVRKNAGMEPLSPVGFGLWSWEVDENYPKPTGDA